MQTIYRVWLSYAESRLQLRLQFSPSTTPRRIEKAYVNRIHLKEFHSISGDHPAFQIDAAAASPMHPTYLLFPSPFPTDLAEDKTPGRSSEAARGGSWEGGSLLRSRGASQRLWAPWGAPRPPPRGLAQTGNCVWGSSIFFQHVQYPHE